MSPIKMLPHMTAGDDELWPSQGVRNARHRDRRWVAFHAIDARIPIFFVNHLRKERQGLCRQRRPAALAQKTVIVLIRDPPEPNAFKVRWEEVGGYRDGLLLAEVAVLDRLVDERLVKSFGYRSDERGAASVVAGLAVA